MSPDLDITQRVVPLDRWPLRGGDPALDLLNTEAYRGLPHFMDLLQTYDVLVAWGISAGALAPNEAGPLLNAATVDPAAADDALRQVKELRSALHVVMQRLTQGEPAPAAALAVLNDARVEGQMHSEIAQVENGFAVRFAAPAALALPHWRLADAATAILTTGSWTRVRECPGEDCGWFFLDTTKNGSRRWCDSADCGNRARTRAYTERKRQAARA
ncbi:MAG: CGNR zinc finger domain-containing protein [Thermomicrobiales bacterium]